jgi:hypothetical protein
MILAKNLAGFAFGDHGKSLYKFSVHCLNCHGELKSKAISRASEFLPFLVRNQINKNLRLLIETKMNVDLEQELTERTEREIKSLFCLFSLVEY